jgi:hypothetical protein
MQDTCKLIFEISGVIPPEYQENLGEMQNKKGAMAALTFSKSSQAPSVLVRR